MQCVNHLQQTLLSYNSFTITSVRTYQDGQRYYMISEQKTAATAKIAVACFLQPLFWYANVSVLRKSNKFNYFLQNRLWFHTVISNLNLLGAPSRAPPKVSMQLRPPFSLNIFVSYGIFNNTVMCDMWLSSNRRGRSNNNEDTVKAGWPWGVSGHDVHRGQVKTDAIIWQRNKTLMRF